MEAAVTGGVTERDAARDGEPGGFDQSARGGEVVELELPATLLIFERRDGGPLLS